jgi:hypothetical protein
MNCNLKETKRKESKKQTHTSVRDEILLLASRVMMNLFVAWGLYLTFSASNSFATNILNIQGLLFT